MILDEDQIADYYEKFAGCSKVTIFPRMPYEGTGHIDMWSKFLDDDTVIVGEILPETRELAVREGGAAAAFSGRIATYLDERSLDLEKLGYKVKRIPMPVPDDYAIRSYTNSLLINGVALVPRYSLGFDIDNFSDYSYSDGQLQSSYEAKVREAYESAGYTVKFLDSDELIAYGGAIHCVTMQLPAASSSL
jgi:agmatine/peptidylarginine deiminase